MPSKEALLASVKELRDIAANNELGAAYVGGTLVSPLRKAAELIEAVAKKEQRDG